MGFVMTIITAVALFDLFWWWRVDRWLRPMPGAMGWRLAWSLFMTLQVACLAFIILGRALDTTVRLDELMPIGLLTLTFIWHMIVLPISVALAVVGMVLGSPFTIARWFRRKPASQTSDDASAPSADPASPDTATTATAAAAPAPPPSAKRSSTKKSPDVPAGPSLVRTARGTRLVPAPAQPDEPEIAREPRQPMTRRQLLGAAAALTPPLVTAISTGVAVSKLDHFRIRRLDVSLPNLPPALEGLTIAHVADVHVGRFTNGRVLDAIVEQSNALKPDLVLLTGDLINHALADLPNAISMVKQLQRKYALATCEGNHDLFEGRREFERRVKNAGITLLVNESTTFTVKGQRVQLMGLQWGRGPRSGSASGRGERGDDAIASSMQSLLEQRRDDAFPILLAHHPHAFDVAADAGIPLTLAGHTHGGQLMLTKNIGFGPNMYRYFSGLYQKGDHALVVSNGVGNWFPLRINAPAEIVYITLRSNAAVAAV